MDSSIFRSANISISERAAERLDARRVMTRFGPDDVFMLVYTFNFVEADGTPVEGFFAGYQAVAQERKYLEPRHALADLPGGMEFYFLPRFEWDARAHYRVDLAGGRYETFSIGTQV